MPAPADHSPACGSTARAGAEIMTPSSNTRPTHIDNKALFVGRICPLSLLVFVYDNAITDAEIESTERMRGQLIRYLMRGLVGQGAIDLLQQGLDGFGGLGITALFGKLSDNGRGDLEEGSGLG